MTEHFKLADDAVAKFATDGFVLTPDVFADAELSHYASAIDAEVAQRNAHDARDVDEKSLYEQSFIQCMRLWETNAIARQLTCHPRLASIAAQLLQQPSVLLWQDQALYKEVGGRETTAHQDSTFWPIGDAPLVTAWIPFDKVQIENGAMAYVPGSHKAGRLRVVDITHSSEPYDILDDPALGGHKPQWVQPDVGDIVWHHGLTVHEAAANSSQQVRRVFTIVYLAAGHQRVKEWPVFPLDRAGVKVGEIMQGEGLPVLWPPPAAEPAVPSSRGIAVGPQLKFQ